MNKLRIAVGLLALLCTAAASTTPAFAKFKAKKAEEGIVKVENTASATNFKVEGATTTLTVTCETIKGSGAVMGKRGKTGNKASEDEPEKEVVAESQQVDLKLTFENCKTTIAGMKLEVKVNTAVAEHICQFEFFQTKETAEKKATANVSLRAAETGKQCEIEIEVPKLCVLEVNAKNKGENEELKELKLENIAAFESEVEPGSRVGGITTTENPAPGKCGIGAIKGSVFEITKAVNIKNVELV